MLGTAKRIAFGPVPSRRLGHSIGINNIPPKICTYSCVYCQLGRTHDLQVTRQPFYSPQDILTDVKQRIRVVKERKEPVDYLTFVADGEPTLDSNLGEEIKLLKTLGLKIAVITNASLLWKKDVRVDLGNADWVSLKIDTLDQQIWRYINRPHSSLNYTDVLEGISCFRKSFNGDLVTETMLIQDVNDSSENLEKVATFITGITPKMSYISIPTRPPAEQSATAATEAKIHSAYHLFKEHGIETEYLIDYEGNTFAFTGNLEEDLLGIMSVHPIREDGLRKLLLKADAGWDIIEKLLMQQEVIETKYNGKKFYMRKFPRMHQGVTDGDLR